MGTETATAVDIAALLWDAREAASALRLSERTLWTLSQPRGSLPVVRIGRSVRYSPDALRAWVEAQERPKGTHP